MSDAQSMLDHMWWLTFWICAWGISLVLLILIPAIAIFVHWDKDLRAQEAAIRQHPREPRPCPTATPRRPERGLLVERRD